MQMVRFTCKTFLHLIPQHGANGIALLNDLNANDTKIGFKVKIPVPQKPPVLKYLRIKD
jgi:hypothetical protein